MRSSGCRNDRAAVTSLRMGSGELWHFLGRPWREDGEGVIRPPEVGPRELNCETQMAFLTHVARTYPKRLAVAGGSKKLTERSGRNAFYAWSTRCLPRRMVAAFAARQCAAVSSSQPCEIR